MVTRIVKDFVGTPTTLAEKRQVRVVCSSDAIDRAGEVVVQSGIDTTHFMALGGTVLFGHDPSQPIAKAVELSHDGSGNLCALVQFPPEGDDPNADLRYKQVLNGILNTVSIGFNPTKMAPMDPAKPRGAQKYTSVELMEFSFVTVPANRDAVVVGKSAEVDPVRKAAAAVVVKAMLEALGDGSVTKGLYSVGALANVLGSLGWIQEDSKWEASYEGDNSPVPAMLFDVMQALGAALVAMVQEEVTELLVQNSDEALDDEIIIMLAGDKPVTKAIVQGVDPVRRNAAAFLYGIMKAGKVLSSTNHTKLQQAHGMIGDVLDAATPSDEDKAAQAQRLRRSTALRLAVADYAIT